MPSLASNEPLKRMENPYGQDLALKGLLRHPNVSWSFDFLEACLLEM